jgi:hypothetical protein
MEYQFLISKEKLKTNQNVILKVCYYDSMIMISLSFSNNEEYYFSYIGTLESLCIFNNVDNNFTLSCFIDECKNMNYFKVDGNVATFKFPMYLLSRNFVVSCYKKTFNKIGNFYTDVNYPFKPLNLRVSKETSNSRFLLETLEFEFENKFLKLSEKLNNIETSFNLLRNEKTAHNLNPIDGGVLPPINYKTFIKPSTSSVSTSSVSTSSVSITINENKPIVFEDHIISIKIKIKCKNYTYKFIFPDSLKYLSLNGGSYNIPIILPDNLIKCKLFNLSKYNYPLKFPVNITEIKLSRLNKFNYPLSFLHLSGSLKCLSLNVLRKFNHSITIPDTTEYLNITSLDKFNSEITLPDSIKILNLGGMREFNKQISINYEIEEVNIFKLRKFTEYINIHPNTCFSLKKFSIRDLAIYNFPIIIPDNTEFVNISNLNLFNSEIRLADSIKVLKIDRLSEFNHPINIPGSSIDEIYICNLDKFNSLITFDEYHGIGGCGCGCGEKRQSIKVLYLRGLKEFNQSITGLSITVENLYMSNLNKFDSYLEFSENTFLKSLELNNLPIFNHPVTIPESLEEFTLCKMQIFNSPIIFSESPRASLKMLKLGELITFNYPLVDMPNTVETIHLSYLHNISSLVLPESIKYCNIYSIGCNSINSINKPFVRYLFRNKNVINCLIRPSN